MENNWESCSPTAGLASTRLALRAAGWLGHRLGPTLGGSTLARSLLARLTAGTALQ